MNSLANSFLTDSCDFSMRPFASLHQALLLRTWYRYIYSWDGIGFLFLMVFPNLVFISTVQADGRWTDEFSILHTFPRVQLFVLSSFNRSASL